MYKVFIVDDESLVITSLKSCVDWEGLGFAVVGEANDGLSAYEAILELKPDIVFADIRMPGMSGLELIKRVYGENQSIRFVIISGYAEFAYVQKALSYGVLGYCLKPFDETEIATLLQRARETLEKSKAAVELELIGLIYDSGAQAHGRVQAILNGAGLHADRERGIVAAVSLGPERLELPANIPHIRLKLGGNRYAYLLQDSSLEDFRARAEAGRPESVLGIGLSHARRDAGYLSDAIDEAGVAASQYFMTGKRGVYSYEEPGQEKLNAGFAELEKAIVKRDVKLIQRSLDALEAELSRGVYSIKSAFQVYNIFLYSFCVLNSEKYESCLYNYEQLARVFKGMHDMFRYLKSLLQEYSGVRACPPPAGAKSETFSNIMAFVNEHFCEDISIHIISEKLSVNPNYVSQLFKRQTGTTFTEQLTNLRVNFACNLLRTTDMTVSEVADRVGFSDYYYFTRVFKKMIGDTPTSYRDKAAGLN